MISIRFRSCITNLTISDTRGLIEHFSRYCNMNVCNTLYFRSSNRYSNPLLSFAPFHFIPTGFRNGFRDRSDDISGLFACLKYAPPELLVPVPTPHQQTTPGSTTTLRSVVAPPSYLRFLFETTEFLHNIPEYKLN